MDAIRSLLLVFAALSALSSHGIIIRHDVGPSRYEVSPSDYPAVFYLEQQGNRRVCVATVIHRRWAITAAHCARETTLGDTIENGRKFAVRVGNRTRLIDLLVVHPLYDEASATDVDLALLRFSEEADNPGPIPLQTESTELDRVVSIIGWGFFGLGTRGRQYDNGVFRLAQNRISMAERRLQIVFDDPRDRSTDALALEGVPSLGDSGGPAFIHTDTGFRLAGVLVGEIEGQKFSEETQGKYGSIAVYERLSEHISWIEAVIGAKVPFDS
jgi:secreted trypsin-like serine protease